MENSPLPRVRTRLLRSKPETRSNRLVVVDKNPDELHPASRRLRRAGKNQLEQLKTNIKRFGCLVPVLATESGEIIDGHTIWQACKDLELAVPTIMVGGLDDPEIRTLRISLNKLAECSSWDDEALREELTKLLDIDPELTFFTGFTSAEIDAFASKAFETQAEEVSAGTGMPLLGLEGDVWCFEGGHVLMQGNARVAASYTHLLGTNKVRAVICDIPYGCSIAGHASRKHSDFKDGSSLSAPQLEELIRSYLTNCTSFMLDGALTYTFMDGPGLLPLLSTAKSLELDQVAICVWDKLHPGMGGFYRQQAEYVIVTKRGGFSHVNNVQLGKNGRNRSNVWPYPGLAGFGAARSDTLAMHPTVKPIGLISDILLDCTRRGDDVLDPFSGTGTILLAAHRTKRRAFAMEIDPKYIDVAIHRMERETGKAAVNRTTGATYAETMQCRTQSDFVHFADNSNID